MRIIRSSWLLLVVLAASVALLAGVALAMSPAELAAESEAYVKSTAKSTPTSPDVIIAKVQEACKLLQAEGRAAFPKFKGKGSKFLFDGTYIWIHSLKKGTMLMHPIKYKLEGRKLLGLKDKKGKRFFVTMNKLAKDKGSGWVEYYWPKPGTKEVVRKISYIQRCKMAGGEEVVIGCGIYNADKAAMSKLEIH